ncbi:MAG: tetratricopeptide repeat protein, partial [Candidatus Obscuribacterales bacterium]|nr:tetratricopeptide repeat protein [Candidatus Obscuribacterales bacterium]
YWLGMCYMGKFEDKKAILSLEKAIQQSIVPLPDAFVAMAEINIRNHDFDSARRNISSAMMNKASFQRCSYLRALMSDAEGKYAVAAGQYRSALGEAPWTWTECWVKYAETLMKMKKWQEAIREFYSILHTDTPLKNEPLDRIYHDIGVCLLAIGDHQGAIDNWFRSLDYNKTNPEVWLQLGMLYEAEKHFSSAVNNYKEFLRLLPPESQDPRIQQVQDRLTKIEHQLRPNETVPEIAKPSPYMRRQVEGAISPQQLNNPDAAAEQAPPVSDMDSGF